jgi:hypothetical protein
MPARVRKIRHDEDTRLRIKVGNILNRLEKAYNGEIELSQTQVNIAKLLLAKVLPDLSSVEHTGEVTHSYVARIPPVEKTTDDWLNKNTSVTRTH